MLDPWNNASILAPPVNMFLCVKKVDVSALKYVCKNIIKVLSKQSPLHKESALCSRFLYKYDQKFRNDIGYRNFRKVHTALKKYLALNLLKDIESFLSALPSESDDEKYLPTRQMLEYVMLRIITFSMIMLRICVCSKQAAIFYLNRIKRGDSHWMSLLPYALLSRLWSMTKVLVQHATTWYSNVYPFLSKLEVKGLNLLPDNYELPEDLEQWLDLKNIEQFGKFNWDKKTWVDGENVLLDGDDENDFFDNILSFINNTNKNESDDELDDVQTVVPCIIADPQSDISTVARTDQEQLLSKENFKIDLGAAVSRESLKIDQGETLSRESFKVLLSNKKLSENSKPMANKRIKQINEQRCPAKMNKITKENDHSQIKITNSKNSKPMANKRVKQINEQRCPAKMNKITKENDHSQIKITNSTELKKFIIQEEKLRNESDIRSQTIHLSFMQWHSLKQALLKLCDSLTNRKIEKKFQNIWKEKCLLYK